MTENESHGRSLPLAGLERKLNRGRLKRGSVMRDGIMSTVYAC